ncbi:MAG TPA: hypothetical protein VFK33_09010 [Bacillales bacterium]|nr:hypothetical protein [Bacillales bacterium]
MLFNGSEPLAGDDLLFCALYAPGSGDQKQTVWFNGSESKDGLRLETDHFFSQILPDDSGHYWLAEHSRSCAKSTGLCVFNSRGKLLKSLSVAGKPNLREFGDSVYAGCEGENGEAQIYEFSKETLTLVQQWTVDGFLWGFEKKDGLLYVASYLAEENLAVMYVIGENHRAAVELGENFFPTDLAVLDDLIHVTACPVIGGGGKRIMQLDESSLEVIREFTLRTSPRQIYSFGSELVVHALELGEDKRDKLICLDLKTGKQREHVIPHSHKIRKDVGWLFLANLKERAVFHWDSEKQKITKVSSLPDHHNRDLLDFQCRHL